MICPLCGGSSFEHVFRYDAPPERETKFDLGGQTYRRDIERCEICGHCLNVHALDLSELYSGAYMDSTYAEDRLVKTYERIMALPPEQSDNRGRAARIVPGVRVIRDGARRRLRARRVPGGDGRGGLDRDGAGPGSAGRRAHARAHRGGRRCRPTSWRPTTWAGSTS